MRQSSVNGLEKEARRQSLGASSPWRPGLRVPTVLHASYKLNLLDPGTNRCSVGRTELHAPRAEGSNGRS